VGAVASQVPDRAPGGGQKQVIEAGHSIPEVDAFNFIGNGYPLPRARFRQLPHQQQRGDRAGPRGQL